MAGGSGKADYSDFFLLTNYSTPVIKALSWAAKTMNSEMHKFNLGVNMVDEEIPSSN